MPYLKRFIVLLIVGLLTATGCHTARTTSNTPQLLRTLQVPLGHQENNMIKTSWPSVACWFWSRDEFKENGYKAYIDLHEQYSSFKYLTASLRAPGDLMAANVYEQVKKAAEYANQKGIGIVMDLDIRLARDSFAARYPAEQQQLLLIKEFPLAGDSESALGIKSKGYADHYTYGRTTYDPVKTELLRVYSYTKEGETVKAGTVKEITNRVASVSYIDSVHIRVSADKTDQNNMVCALVAVTLSTPDVFAPHILSFQREIIKKYADASLAGAAKDEWGFPGRFATPTDELWYSPAMAVHYAKRRGGNDLLRDLLLMSKGEEGRHTDRVAAINHYMEMNWQRNGEIETDFYKATKEYFGEAAMSATHPTWFPYPDNREVFKNGLSWWFAKRDLAQTDEATPFSIRTSLTKKMFSPLWLNMYYDKEIAPYYKDIWRAALAGGRLNYHPLYPAPGTKLERTVLKDSLMIAESRISLLNYISESPADCPVAVVFGHAGALNWSDNKQFADVGLNVANQLWMQGYFADLIPSSEITTGALYVNGNGKIQYGPQEYEAVIFYQPEYEKNATNHFWEKAVAGSSGLLRVGDWTTDFEGHALTNSSFAKIQKLNKETVVKTAISLLQAKNIKPQTTGEEHTVAGFPPSVMPKGAGQLRLIDGTRILIAGENNTVGDPIDTSIEINGVTIKVNAVGVAAVRLGSQGKVEAMAAGGLTHFVAKGLTISLSAPVDIAMYKMDGRWQGILHGNGTVPPELLKITKHWQRVKWQELKRD